MGLFSVVAVRVMPLYLFDRVFQFSSLVPAADEELGAFGTSRKNEACYNGRVQSAMRELGYDI